MKNKTDNMTNIKRKRFSNNMYREFMTQLKIPGIIFLLICFFSTAIPYVAEFVTKIDKGNSNLGTTIKKAIEMESLSPTLGLFVFVAPIVMIFSLFGFLTKRNASDFYHSLPNSRSSIYFSAIGAAMTYMTAIMTITIGTGILGALLTGKLLIFTDIPYVFMYYFSAMFLLSTICTLACSISGTMLVNFVLTGLIFAYPRIILLMFGHVLTSSLALVKIEFFGILFNSEYNVPFNLISSVFGIMNGPNMSFVGSYIYSIVLGIIYLCIGLILFIYRKSELAETNAPSRFLQDAYRSILVFPIMMLIPLSVFFKSIFDMDILSFLMVCVITVIIYIAYELITTRKIKNLKKIILPYFITLLTATVLTLSIYGVKLIILYDIPKVDDISYVRIISSEKVYSGDLVSYESIMRDTTKFTDSDIKRIISESLKTEAETIRKAMFDRKNKSMEETAKSTSASVELVLNNGRSLKRVILVPNEHNIWNYMIKDKKFLEKFRKLPQENEIYSIATENTFLTEEDKMTIYRSYVEECNNIDDSEYINSMNDMSENTYTHTKGIYIGETYSLDIYGGVGTKRFLSHYTISDKLPKTKALYISLATERSRQNTLDMLDTALYMTENNDDIEYGTVYIYFTIESDSIDKYNQFTEKHLHTVDIDYEKEYPEEKKEAVRTLREIAADTSRTYKSTEISILIKEAFCFYQGKEELKDENNVFVGSKYWITEEEANKLKILMNTMD